MKEREYKWLLTKYEVLCLDEFIERLPVMEEKSNSISIIILIRPICPSMRRILPCVSGRAAIA